MTIGKKIASGFGLALLSLALIGALAYWSSANLLASNDKVIHTYRVIENLDSLLVLLLNQETAQRGYLLTEDSEFKKPLTDANPVIPKVLEQITKLTSDNDEQQKRARELERRTQARLAYTDETIQKAETGDKAKGFDAARGIVKLKRGKKLMDDVRDTIKDMIDAEKSLLEARQAASQRNASLVMATIGIGGAAACVALVVIATLTILSINTSLRDGVNRLAAASAEILAGTTQQATGAQEQAAAVTQTMTTVDEVTQTADQSAQRAKVIDEAVQRNLEIGKTGRKVVEDSLVAMEAVKEQTGSTAESILRLAEQAQAIGEIIATVNELAEQSNLLALNAGIEASRAGEHGRGFTVVAAEVKALADQSKKATAQVRQILGDIQKSTNSAVLSTEAVTKGVASAIKVAGQAGQTIKSLGETLTDTAQGIKQIAASAAQQATGMTQINQAMRNIDQVAKQNAVATRQAAAAAEDLNKLGNQLGAIVGS